MAGEPSFSIPAWPTRRFPRQGGVEYEGQTIFELIPTDTRENEQLTAFVEDMLRDGPYRYGDFLNLPMSLYLVRDEGTGDVFRVSIRDGRIRLHVLPATESAGLERFHQRLTERSSTTWQVECRTTA